MFEGTACKEMVSAMNFSATKEGLEIHHKSSGMYIAMPDSIPTGWNEQDDKSSFIQLVFKN